MARRLLLALALATLVAVSGSAQTGVLDIYFIDTEGGQATLLKTPSGETLMFDTGFAGLDTNNPDKEAGRDAARIAEVAKVAGVKQIDTLVVSHYHGDHVGGVTNLAAILPVRRFVDHGASVQDVEPLRQKVGMYSELYEAEFKKGQHQVVVPGDKVAMKDLDITVVQALGKSIERAGPANPGCEGVPQRQGGNPEDSASVGVVVRFGKFTYANFGDLPWNMELQLLCPTNRVGVLDVYEAARHGNEPSPAAYAMAPRVVVYGNGARKGGGPAPLKAFRGSPGLEDIWQRHKNVPGGAEGNPADEFSANLQDTDQTNHPAHYLKVTARNDGSFSVYNSRTNMTKAYGARGAAATR